MFAHRPELLPRQGESPLLIPTDKELLYLTIVVVGVHAGPCGHGLARPATPPTISGDYEGQAFPRHNRELAAVVAGEKLFDHGFLSSRHDHGGTSQLYPNGRGGGVCNPQLLFGSEERPTHIWHLEVYGAAPRDEGESQEDER